MAAAYSAAAHDITGLLRASEAGDRQAAEALFAALYADLRRVAHRELRGSPIPNATLSTTALVNEAYLKLSRNAGWSPRDRYHFFAVAARAMRQVIVDHARSRLRQKRGGQHVKLSLDEALVPVEERAEELVALDGALARLESQDPELARIVEWRFFAGLTVEEIARALEVSERTVKRHWRTARAFLYRDLEAQGFAL